MTVFMTSSSWAMLELQGKWQIVSAKPDVAPMNFIRIRDGHHAYLKDEVLQNDGRISHTVEQSFTAHVNFSDWSISGQMDYFDSRGCAFENLEFEGEFQTADEVNLLITYPRYRILTITSGDQTSNRPHRYPPTTHTQIQCELVDHIQIPIQLKRIKTP